MGAFFVILVAAIGQAMPTHAQQTKLTTVSALPRVVHECAQTFSTKHLKYKQFPGSADGNVVTWPIGTTRGDTLLLMTTTVTDTGFADVELSNVYMPAESNLDTYTAVARRGRSLVAARGMVVACFTRVQGRWIHERTMRFPRRVRNIDVVNDTTIFIDLCDVNLPADSGTNTFSALFSNLDLTRQSKIEVNPGLSAASLKTVLPLAAPIGHHAVAFVREFDGDVLIAHQSGRIDTVRLFTFTYSADDSVDLRAASERRYTAAAAAFIQLANLLRKRQTALRSLVAIDDSTIVVSGLWEEKETRGLQAGQGKRGYITIRLPHNGVPRVIQCIGLDGTLESDIFRDVVRIGPWITVTANGYIVEAVPYEVETTRDYTMKQFLDLSDERATMDEFTFRLMARSTKGLLP